MRPRLHFRTLLVGIPFLTCAALYAQSSASNAVTAVRFWTLNDATRIVVETTDEFEFRSDRAINPERLFFDVIGAKPRLGKKRLHTIAVGDRLLKQIRLAETAPGITRVVFDLESPVEHTASILTNPYRLIVELRPAGAAPPVLVSSSSSELSTVPVARIPAAIRTPVPEPVLDADGPPVVGTNASATTVRETRTSPLPAPPAARRTTQSAATLSIPARTQTPRAAKLGDANSMTRVLGLKIGRVVLDAGHGGHDTGTIGRGGLQEKDLVLDVVKRLGALIEKRMGAEVIYTREDDTFIPLERRTEIANEKRADLFLSIHANSSPATSSSGIETYYLSFASSKEALETAARENASSQKTVYELRDLIQKIAFQDKMDESREFAAKIQQSLFAAAVRANSRNRDRGVKKAPFVVLIGASMPSVLAEIGFVSNPRDEALFKKSAVRQKIAEGLYRGLAQYAATLSQFQVASN